MDEATISTRLSLLEACTRNHTKYSIGERHTACLTVIDLLDSAREPFQSVSSHLRTYLRRAEGTLAAIDLELGDCIASSLHEKRVQDLGQNRDISPFLKPGPDFLTCAELSEILPTASVLRSKICTPNGLVRNIDSTSEHILDKAPLRSATTSPILAPEPTSALLPAHGRRLNGRVDCANANVPTAGCQLQKRARHPLHPSHTQPSCTATSASTNGNSMMVSQKNDARQWQQQKQQQRRKVQSPPRHNSERHSVCLGQQVGCSDAQRNSSCFMTATHKLAIDKANGTSCEGTGKRRAADSASQQQPRPPPRRRRLGPPGSFQAPRGFGGNSGGVNGTVALGGNSSSSSTGDAGRSLMRSNGAGLTRSELRGSRSTAPSANSSTAKDDEDTEAQRKAELAEFMAQHPRLQSCEPALVDKIMREIRQQGDSVTFEDIAGLDFAKRTVDENVCLPMRRPDLFTGLRAFVRGLLLFGPPGTGKTMIAKAIAHQSGATFFSISSSSLTSKWIGEGEKLVRSLFAVAAALQPSVIFIDEIDSLLSQRSSEENEASRRMKTEFLVQLDGAGTLQTDQILLLGATNRPQELDEAARRRFVKKLYIPLPDAASRSTHVRRLLSKNAHNLDDADIQSVVAKARGYSGSDLSNLCREAAMGPLRTLYAAGGVDSAQAASLRPISHADFEMAFTEVRASVAPAEITAYKEWNEQHGSFKVPPGT